MFSHNRGSTRTLATQRTKCSSVLDVELSRFLKDPLRKKTSYLSSDIKALKVCKMYGLHFLEYETGILVVKNGVSKPC